MNNIRQWFGERCGSASANTSMAVTPLTNAGASRLTAPPATLAISISDSPQPTHRDATRAPSMSADTASISAFAGTRPSLRVCFGTATSSSAAEGW
jgi:hypothetical protein